MSFLTDVAQFLKDYGLLGVVILIIAGGVMRFYVFGRFYSEAQSDAVFWRNLYLSNVDKTAKALDTLQDTISLVREQSRSQINNNPPQRRSD
jgi:hypothetical protein